MTAAEELASYCARLRWRDLPQAVHSRTVELLLDLLGVAIGGSAAQSSDAAWRGLAPFAGRGDVTVIGRANGAEPELAALLNGTAAHALELDDVTRESSLHPGVAVIPAALAMAEACDVNPHRFLEAIVAGYEVTLRAGNALNAASAYQRGFHPTGVAGVFGAATATGVILGLDAPRLAQAMGIAGTLAAGSLEYLSDGAWTKRLNAGWAAHSGIVAARLADAGFTGPTSVFEGRLGLLHAYTDAPMAARLLDDLGGEPRIMHVGVKPYACCRYNHGLIDGVLRIRERRLLHPDEIRRVRLGVLSGGALLVAEPIEHKRRPKNVVDAQFSAPFAAAVALVTGEAGVEQYSQQNIDDAAIQGLMAKTECFSDDRLDREFPAQWPAVVEIETTDGELLREEVAFALGEPENPLSTPGLISKFLSLAQPVIDVDAAFADAVLGLDASPSLGWLWATLRQSRS